ncbi:hypothetical protein M2347_000443 [Chryseobacterium sp. H1D6B]|uniref:hypothetical protein n=1 Tax=Chryseobacterium sp. H1D6B TaxID=2940588 RepID=UPI0015CD83E0|nr:hypothetical protein [Chryseobacterium sp. H1D6B]MDH6250716.1 hypothetical protein [Chryseobacterium sp. H1D6B]
MRKTFLFLLLSTTAVINAQIKFEKGYIITSDNNRKEVLIKNAAWANNPEAFTYKSDENSNESTGNPQNTKEFGVYGYAKYITYKGSIDYSSDNLSELSSSAAPEFKESTVFLRELVSGDKILYSYKTQRSATYLYADSASNIQPLIYKKYHPEGNENQVATNESYIEQLKTIFKDDADAKSMAVKTRYSETSLIKIFKVHNAKSETASNDQFETKPTSLKFNLSIRPGINFYSPLKIDNMFGNQDFPSKTNFRIGIEAELVLPFNKNKWAVLLEPTYSAYTNKKMSIPANDDLYTIKMEGYSFISLPIGIRHYMYLNKTSKLFINGQLNVLTLKTGKGKNVDLDYDGFVFDRSNLSSSQSFNSFSFGAGYTYNNKYTVEFKYTANSDITENGAPQTASIKYTSIILGYNIF